MTDTNVQQNFDKVAGQIIMIGAQMFFAVICLYEN
jgi:hypothetical protein